MRLRNITFASIALALSGCWGFVHDEHLTGPYRLIAVETRDDMSLCYGLEAGSAIGRVGATVFSVGWNTQFIVVKQHPAGNRSVTHFYFVDMPRDSQHADQKASVTGPLTETQFLQKKQELLLPDFTRTVGDLE